MLFFPDTLTLGWDTPAAVCAQASPSFPQTPQGSPHPETRQSFPHRLHPDVRPEPGFANLK